ncbi:hypothetical protein D0862_11555 [Hortaea werneckii]|uniref:Beta-glucuronidase n=1 Tax=Hortaea werneckii TaxID=91943 RepID=A0A3M7F5R7_HORWE|nr:hypothetical protein D0862_11555 [Hortaea werneckii]
MIMMSIPRLLSTVLPLLAPVALAQDNQGSLLDVEQPLINLRPQRSSFRDLINLDGLWKFALVPEADRNATESWSEPLSTDLECPVPASYNDIFVNQSIHDHVGWVRYQRDVLVPRGWSTEDRYLLRAESATHRGRIYVNDRPVADHQGGYTPFEADITELVAAGEEFRLTIAVNNELTYETLPPGEISIDEYTGEKKQTYFHDFYNYAGLARSIWMYSVPQQHIQDITLVTDVDGDTGIIHYDVEVANRSGARVNVSLVDEEGQMVADCTGFSGELRVESANLWQPGAAYLYQFQATVIDSSDAVVDIYSLATGIRTVAVNGTEFLINGRPFYFTGFGKHEDSPVRGKGHDGSYMVHDFQLLNWIGANSFRTSHYPYSEDVMDFADRQGMVVIDETTAVGLNLGIGQGAAGPETFRPDVINNVTQTAHKQIIRELIRRDKNHASVVMWSLANEPAAQEDGARPYFEPLTELARELDSTRPITYANQGDANYTADKIADFFDVTMINRYYGWYEQTGDLAAAEVALEESLQGWEQTYPRPIIMSEYGVDTIAGLHAVDPVPFSEEFQTDYLEMYHRVFDRTNAMTGEHVWNFADFQTSIGVRRVDGNKKGIFTRERRPKSAAQALKSRWNARNAFGWSE